MVCVHACLLGSLAPFPWRGTAECALCSQVCTSAAAEGADMGVSAVLPGASAPIKVETDLFFVVEGGCSLRPPWPLHVFLADSLE